MKSDNILHAIQNLFRKKQINEAKIKKLQGENTSLDGDISIKMIEYKRLMKYELGSSVDIDSGKEVKPENKDKK